MQHIETWTIDRNSGSDHAIVGLRLDIPTQGNHNPVYTTFAKDQIAMA
jgi:hypothetical protein